MSAIRLLGGLFLCWLSTCVWGNALGFIEERHDRFPSRKDLNQEINVQSNFLIHRQKRSEGQDEEEALKFLSKIPAHEDPNKLYLTPWWNLTFATGETVQVDCGIYTGGDPVSVSLSWKMPNDEVIKDDSKATNRIFATRSDKNGEIKSPSSFSVLTLNIENLTITDSGVYTCCSSRIPETENSTTCRKIELQVEKNIQMCNFEESSLCGWTNDPSSKLAWHRHDGSEQIVINATRGPKFDHTYGPSKTAGHFMELDITHYKKDETEAEVNATLVSPKYGKSQKHRCFEFWYVYDGKDQDSLSVYAEKHEDRNNSTLVLQVDIDQGGGWKLGRATIPPQDKDFHIVIQGVTCTRKCVLASMAIDDVRLHEGQCESKGNTWNNNSLPLRLVNGNRTSEGRVEVLHDGKWGTICGTRFGNSDAKVICKMLGYDNDKAIAKRYSEFGAAPDTYMIWLNRVQCSGSESDLGSCQSTGWGNTRSCNHEMDASVYCEGFPPGTPVTPKVVPTTKLAPTTTTTTTTTTPTTTTEKASTTTTPPTTKPTTTAATTSTKQTTTVPTTTTTVKATTTPVTTTTTTKQTTTTTAQTTTTADKKGPAYDVNTSTEGSGSSTTHSNATTVPKGHSYLPSGKNTKVAAGITLTIITIVIILAILIYKKKKNRRKSKYITFGNPVNYDRMSIPSNDISLESPLTSSGHSIIT